MAAPVVASSTTAVNSGGAISKPAGTTAGDLLVLIVVSYDANDITAACTGFTNRGRASYNAGYKTSTNILDRVADGTEGSGFTVTGIGGNYTDIMCLRVTGAHATAPFDTASTNTGASTTATALGLTTATADELLILGHGGYSASITSGYSGWTNVINALDGVNYAYARTAASAGAVGNSTASLSSDPANTWAVVVAAYKPPQTGQSQPLGGTAKGASRAAGALTTTQPTPIVVGTPTTGSGASATSATVTLPSYASGEQLLLFVERSAANAAVFGAAGDVTLAELAQAGTRRLAALKVTPTQSGVASFTLTWATAANYRWVCFPVSNAADLSAGAYTTANTSDSTSTIAVPTLTLGYTTTGQELGVVAFGVNTTATWTTTGATIWNTTTGNAAMMVNAYAIPAGSTTLDYLAVDRGAGGSSRQESVISAALKPGPAGLPQALAGTAGTASRAAGALSVERPLDATAKAASRATGTVSGAKPLGGVAKASSHASGTVRAARPLDATAKAASRATGTVSVLRVVAGTARAAAKAVGVLVVATEFGLTGTAEAASRATGPLQVTHPLSGAAGAVSRAAGTISPTRSLTGAGMAASRATASPSVARSFAGAARSATQASGVLAVARTLAASAHSASTASGSLVVTAHSDLNGTVRAASRSKGGLTVSSQASGVARSASESSGSLSVTRSMSGTARAATGAAGAVSVTRPLHATVTASARVVGLARVERGLTATATAAGRAAGVLVVGQGQPQSTKRTRRVTTRPPRHVTTTRPGNTHATTRDAT